MLVGVLPRVLLQLRVELRQHKVGDIDVGPVGRVRGHSRYVSVARLAEHVVHAVGKPLPVRQLNLLGESPNIHHPSPILVFLNSLPSTSFMQVVTKLNLECFEAV